MEIPTSSFVLIVEDSEEARLALEIALQAWAKCGVYSVSDGVEALAVLAAHPGKVSAVITDLDLPRLNGLELIGHIKHDRRSEHVPVIVVSADPYPDTPERSRRLGAAAFFQKPYSPNELLSTLEKLLYADIDSHRGDSDVVQPMGWSNPAGPDAP